MFYAEKKNICICFASIIRQKNVYFFPAPHFGVFLLELFLYGRTSSLLVFLWFRSNKNFQHSPELRR